MVIDCEHPPPEPLQAEDGAKVDAKALKVSSDSVSWV